MEASYTAPPVVNSRRCKMNMMNYSICGYDAISSVTGSGAFFISWLHRLGITEPADFMLGGSKSSIFTVDKEEEMITQEFLYEESPGSC